MRRKRLSRFNFSNLVLGFMLVVAVILVLATILISINLSKDKDKLDVASETHTTLQQKLNDLTPNKISLPAGKFPLEANERLLSRAYLKLMAFVYQKSDSTKPFEANKDTLSQYFSSTGVEKLKQSTLLQDGSKIRSLSSKLQDCTVTFSNFDLKHRTVGVTIYSTYLLAKPVQGAKTGVSLINLTYNFDFLSVSDFDMRSTTVNDQEVF